MVEFCPENQSFPLVWVDSGLTPCFSDVISWCVALGVGSLVALGQVYYYWKFSTYSGLNNRKPSRWYRFQIVLHLLLIILAVVHFFLKTFLTSKKFYGYELLVTIVKFIIWTAVGLLILMERKRQLPSIPNRAHGAALLVLWILAFAAMNLPFISWWSSLWWWQLRSNNDWTEFGLWLSEYVLVGMALLIGLKAPALDMSTYTTIDADTNSSSGSTWKGLFKKVKMIAPMVWPRGNILLQLCVIASALLLVAGRICNLGVPIYYKLIVDDIQTRFCWDYILIWVTLRFLQGGGTGSSGVLSNFRSFLWINVQQYTTKETEVRLFSHLHSLSLRWHLSKKTGEVLKIMDRGTTSVNNLLNYVVFNILPTVADILIAVVYFISAFDIYFGIIVLGTMILYLIATIAVTEWRTKYRREMNLLENAYSSRAVDSLINFETVKYYGNADFEVQKYDEAIRKYQKVQWKALASLNLLNSVQNIIITLGLLVGAFLCAWYIHDGQHIRGRQVTVGDFVLFGTYLVQLYGPLNFFGTYYRMIQSSFIDMENMFDLFAEQQEVKDIADAKALEIKQGVVEFKDVYFQYEERKPVLQGISFKIPAGETYALVGPSGSGKTSIIRLLFRFYDIQKGSILIDGQDISQVKQESVRKAVGIVPQDTVLFNADIKYNIAYGNTSAVNCDVTYAAEAADIHSKITSFPNGYETVVGERGLKLSGGEKQRVAIARTLLKNPHIVLLDEATSALDTHTERNILRSFERICANKTTIVVAHRLSTIIDADQILVLDNGVIKERGTHDELLSSGGIYHAMWAEQQKKRESAPTDDDYVVDEVDFSRW